MPAWLGARHGARTCASYDTLGPDLSREVLAGLHYLQRAMDDERSERTRSVPSVASRRVAAPYGVDDLALKRSISSQKVLNFKARYARQCRPSNGELATLAGS